MSLGQQKEEEEKDLPTLVHTQKHALLEFLSRNIVTAILIILYFTMFGAAFTYLSISDS